MIPKFRAWDKCEDEMVYDIFFDWQDCGYGSLSECFADSRWIFMQSAGLVDKNGKEIFEGDVVNAYDLDRDEGRIFKTVDLVGVVEYKGISFCLKDDRGIYNDLWINAEEYEVIGNIHQHPNLLEDTDGH